uniref:Putative formyl transferase n=1 Tax=viral metagenome TaxID=1070528 RepID=A0A6M3ITM6_9ZZZZ
MKVVLFGKGERFEACKNVLAGYDPSFVEEKNFVESDWEFSDEQRCYDVYILAGLSKILGREFINSPKIILNLHAGKLPEYRGSSPLNWALINGEKEFTLSIIKVDEGIDTGDILYERTMPIEDIYDIKDLTRLANKNFPSMLVHVLCGIDKGYYNNNFYFKRQSTFGNYYPMRFSEDSIIWFDRFTAEEVRNRVRALNDDRYRAFAWYVKHDGLKVYFNRCEIPTDNNYYGIAGVIFKIDNTNKRLLVGTKDKAVWLYPDVFTNGIFDRYAHFTQ